MEDAISKKKEYHKIYMSINREKINENRREVYRKKRNVIYTCICGTILALSNKEYHEKKQIHLNYI